MPKAKSPETTIHEYFQTADLAKAEVLFEIVKSTLKSRQAAAGKTENGGVKKSPVKRAARGSKNAAAGTETAAAEGTETVGSVSAEDDN